MFHKELLTCAILLSSLITTSASAQSTFIEPGFSPTGPVPILNLQAPLGLNNSQISTPTSPSNITSSTNTGGDGRLPAVTDPVGLALIENNREASLETRTETTVDVVTQETSQRRYIEGQKLTGLGKTYDGHSITVDGNPVRLNGIEAPGRGQLCHTKSGTAWRCGKKAYERLAVLVDGKKVSCIVDSPAGTGAAATCSSSRVSDIGRLLVSEGLAIPNKHSKNVYRQEVRSANSMKKGIWVGSFKEPSKWRLQNQ